MSQERGFQGSWYSMDEHLKPVVGEPDTEVYRRFDNGYFEMYACCFAQDDFLKGYYEIVELKAKELLLELSDIRNHGVPLDGSCQITIEILDDSDRLMINWTGPYDRLAEGN